jgi:flagellin
MALRINTNIGALTAHRFLTLTDSALTKSVERLSSGYRINVAADDPAGLVISENLRANAAGLGQALANTQHAINMVKTAEAAMAEVNNLLRTMRDLAVHAANTGVNDADSIAADQSQITEMLASIDRIATNTSFATKKLLDGTAVGLVFHVGAYANETVNLDLPDMASATLFLAAPDVTVDAQAAITDIDAAILSVSNSRASLGAYQKGTLETNLVSLAVAQENVTASESTIRDADMALEMVSFTRNQIILQAGASMLTQANQVPQVVLQMLQ